MNVDSSMCASSGRAIHWAQIDWPKCERQVRRLQARIVKATMKDRAMQALYLLALEPIAETAADPNSYGFRRERSTADALQQCFNTLCRGCSAPWILEGDIKGCFDHISHDWMLQHVPTDKGVLQKWLKAGYVENRNRFPTEAGTPQGGIMTPRTQWITSSF